MPKSCCARDVFGLYPEGTDEGRKNRLAEVERFILGNIDVLVVRHMAFSRDLVILFWT